MIYDLDLYLFYAINSLAGKNPFFDIVISFFAVSLIWVLFAGFVFFVLYKSDYTPHIYQKIIAFFRLGFILDRFKINYKIFTSGVLSVLISYFISQLISFVYFRPRVFTVVDDSIKLISKSPLDKSFPSDHATVAFAFSFIVYFFDKKAGAVFLALSFLIGLARVYTGVHYPFDIIGGIILAWVVSFFVFKIVNRVLR